jgi:hypothetical protein
VIHSFAAVATGAGFTSPDSPGADALYEAGRDDTLLTSDSGVRRATIDQKHQLRRGGRQHHHRDQDHYRWRPGPQQRNRSTPPGLTTTAVRLSERLINRAWS